MKFIGINLLYIDTSAFDLTVETYHIEKDIKISDEEYGISTSKDYRWLSDIDVIYLSVLSWEHGTIYNIFWKN